MERGGQIFENEPTIQAWNDVIRCIDAFSEAWSTGSPPPIKDALPGPDDPARLIALAELIKIDMEERFQRDLPRRSALDYAQDFPELAGPEGIPIDLLYEEVHLRQRFEGSADLEGLCAAHPRQAEELRRLLRLGKAESSTSMRTEKPRGDYQVGDTLDDFDLVGQLGRGAFATVFLARQRSLQRLVALKLSADRGQEPQTLARLDHPHIVRVYDQRVIPEKRLRMLYMQYIPGGTLQEVAKSMQFQPRAHWSGTLFVRGLDRHLAERGVPAPDDSRQRQRILKYSWQEVVCLLGQQLAEALDYAHRQGVLHRDIKPANVLISPTASPMLVDFNISYCSKIEGLSATAYFGGSLAYMSPEQLEACNPRHERSADSLDGRSDVYSLGIVLWELLAGTRPFQDRPPQDQWSSTLEALAAQRREGVAAAGGMPLPPEVAPAIREVVEQCLAPRADDRFATAGQLAENLQLCLSPDVRRLLTPPKRGLALWVARWPAFVMVITVVIPHLLGSWLNYRFNLRTLDLSAEGATELLGRTILWNNIVAFPIGVIVGVWLMAPIAREVRRRFTTKVDEPAAEEMRTRSLRLGRYFALTGIALWMLAGLPFPILMIWRGTPLSGVEAFNFWGSLGLCGAWCAVYPFFAASTMLLEIWYPALIRPSIIRPQDVHALDWLERVSLIYLVLAATVPLFSLGALTLRGKTEHPLVLGVLSIGGLALFAAAFLLWWRLQRHLSLLKIFALQESR